MAYNIGDIVHVIAVRDNRDWRGQTAIVRKIDDTRLELPVAVEFEGDAHGRHSCGGYCADRRGFWYGEADLEPVSSAPRDEIPPAVPGEPPTELSAAQKALLGPTLAHLISVGNPALREMVAAATGLWIPPEAQPAAWLAANLTPPPPPPPVRRHVEPTIDFEFSYTERESGTCCHTVGNYYRGRHSLTESELRDICEEHDWNVRRVAEAVAGIIDSDGEADCDEQDDYDYDNYESTNCDRDNTEYPGLRDIISDFVSDNQPPEEDDDE